MNKQDWVAQMPDNQDLQTLMQLGLSNLQAKVYLVMTKFEAARARAIWKASKVGRQDVYRILDELQKLGLVEKVVAAPAEYVAIPLAAGAAILLQRRKNEFTKLQTEALKLLEIPHLNEQAKSLNQYQCVMVPKKEVNVLRVNQAYDRARRSINISSTLKRLSTGLSTYKAAEAINRGLHVKVIVNTKDKNWFEKILQPFKMKPNFELRQIDQPAAPYGIFDEREVFVSTSTESGLLDAPMLWINYPDIVNLFVNHFNMQWNSAKKKQASINPVRQGTPS